MGQPVCISYKASRARCFGYFRHYICIQSRRAAVVYHKFQHIRQLVLGILNISFRYGQRCSGSRTIIDTGDGNQRTSIVPRHHCCIFGKRDPSCNSLLPPRLRACLLSISGSELRYSHVHSFIRVRVLHNRTQTPKATIHTAPTEGMILKAGYS